MNIYSIKDNKIGFGQVFIAPNNAAAIRLLQDTVRGGDNMIANHPEDFVLYLLGNLNDQDGIITPEVQYLEAAGTFAPVKAKTTD